MGGKVKRESPRVSPEQVAEYRAHPVHAELEAAVRRAIEHHQQMLEQDLAPEPTAKVRGAIAAFRRMLYFDELIEEEASDPAAFQGLDRGPGRHGSD